MKVHTPPLDYSFPPTDKDFDPMFQDHDAPFNDLIDQIIASNATAKPHDSTNSHESNSFASFNHSIDDGLDGGILRDFLNEEESTSSGSHDWGGGGKGPQSPNFQNRDCLDFFSSSSQDPQIQTTQVQVQQRIKAAKTEACLRSKYRRAAHQFDGQKPAISGSQLLSLEGKFTAIPFRPLPLREGSSSSKENHHLPVTKSLRRKPKFCKSSTVENVPETLTTPTPKRKSQNRISKSVTNLRGEHERGKDTMMSPSYYRRGHQHEVGTSNSHDCWTEKFGELALRGGGGAAGSIDHLPLSARASVHFQDDRTVKDLLDAAGDFGLTSQHQDAMTMQNHQGVYSPPAVPIHRTSFVQSISPFEGCPTQQQPSFTAPLPTPPMSEEHHAAGRLDFGSPFTDFHLDPFTNDGTTTAVHDGPLSPFADNSGNGMAMQQYSGSTTTKASVPPSWLYSPSADNTAAENDVIGGQQTGFDFPVTGVVVPPEDENEGMPLDLDHNFTFEGDVDDPHNNTMDAFTGNGNHDNAAVSFLPTPSTDSEPSSSSSQFQYPITTTTTTTTVAPPLLHSPPIHFSPLAQQEQEYHHHHGRSNSHHHNHHHHSQSMSSIHDPIINHHPSSSSSSPLKKKKDPSSPTTASSSSTHPAHPAHPHPTTRRRQSRPEIRDRRDKSRLRKKSSRNLRKDAGVTVVVGGSGHSKKRSIPNIDATEEEGSRPSTTEPTHQHHTHPHHTHHHHRKPSPSSSTSYPSKPRNNTSTTTTTTTSPKKPPQSSQKRNSCATSSSSSSQFINLTSHDSTKILLGVAPSGSSKTKARREIEERERELGRERERELERQKSEMERRKSEMEQRRKMSEVAERAVREGDVRILEQMVGGEMGMGIFGKDGDEDGDGDGDGDGD